MNFKLNDELPVHRVIAENYALHSSNKIHSPEVARKLGFTGGLVPGVGIYTYMIHPLITYLGTDWLKQGFVKAKFLKPVYEAEQIMVRSKITSLDPLNVKIEITNAEGVLCAVGTADLRESPAEPKIADYPPHPVPKPGNRFPARSDASSIGAQLGSIPVAYHLDDTEAYFFEKHRDLMMELLTPEAMHHPALLLHLANLMTKNSINLGPWIHTGSEVQHYNLPTMNTNMQLNGKILDAYERRGHDYVVLDLAVFTDTALPIARIKHTAIIKPKGG